LPACLQDGCGAHKMGCVHGHSHKNTSIFFFISYFCSVPASKNICQNSVYFRSPVWQIF
jgi:hypothetical protein